MARFTVGFGLSRRKSLRGLLMAVINPEGLYQGDRLRRCSDEARMAFPHVYLSGNNYARLELNPIKIQATVFSTFNTPPSIEIITKWIQEYRAQGLLFIYSADGQLWGQWDTRQEWLPRHKNAADQRSPAPPQPAFDEWQERNRTKKAATQALADDAELFPRVRREISASSPRGVGVGVGEGKNILPDPEPDTKPTTADLHGLVQAVLSKPPCPGLKANPTEQLDNGLSLEETAISLVRLHPKPAGFNTAVIECMKSLEQLAKEESCSLSTAADRMRDLLEGYRQSEEGRKTGKYAKTAHYWFKDGCWKSPASWSGRQANPVVATSALDLVEAQLGESVQ